MRHAKRVSRKGFSLIELVIVVVIIGIIAAIAIPKMSRGASAAADSALAADMYMWRQALDMYMAEHDGAPPDSPDTIVNQLTLYTDISGATSPSKTGAFVFGPYLKTIPAIPVGLARGKNLVVEGSAAVPTDSTTAWYYHGDTTNKFYTIIPNATGPDSLGNPYSGY